MTLDPESQPRGGGPAKRLNLFGRKFTLPQSRLVRITVGVLLILFGLVGFLPIVGFWMIPLGVVVLSYDIAPIRRLRRRFETRGRRKGKGAGK